MMTEKEKQQGAFVQQIQQMIIFIVIYFMKVD